MEEGRVLKIILIQFGIVKNISYITNLNPLLNVRTIHNLDQAN